MTETTVVLKEHQWANGTGADYTFNDMSFGVPGPGV